MLCDTTLFCSDREPNQSYRERLGKEVSKVDFRDYRNIVPAFRAEYNLKFTLEAEGKHGSMLIDPAQKDRIIEIASAKPVPRPPPFRRGTL